MRLLSVCADPPEDDASFNVSTVNRTRAASVSLSTSCFTWTKFLQYSNFMSFCQTENIMQVCYRLL